MSGSAYCSSLTPQSPPQWCWGSRKALTQSWAWLCVWCPQPAPVPLQGQEWLGEHIQPLAMLQSPPQERRVQSLFSPAAEPKARHVSVSKWGSAAA